jgi:hypothetical protein
MFHRRWKYHEIISWYMSSVDLLALSAFSRSAFNIINPDGDRIKNNYLIQDQSLLSSIAFSQRLCKKCNAFWPICF